MVDKVGVDNMPVSEDKDIDPSIGEFLQLLERDMIAHPENLRALTCEDFNRLEALIDGIVVDLDEEIEGDVGL